jgi:hypothetical protein
MTILKYVENKTGNVIYTVCYFYSSLVYIVHKVHGRNELVEDVYD